MLVNEFFLHRNKLDVLLPYNFLDMNKTPKKNQENNKTFYLKRLGLSLFILLVSGGVGVWFDEAFRPDSYGGGGIPGFYVPQGIEWFFYAVLLFVFGFLVLRTILGIYFLKEHWAQSISLAILELLGWIILGVMLNYSL